ncbi:unnamed protein product [Nezara viridula]|uniref:Uncharacterized protein n=1 Tax=Nezara viridula TaxID=85310 RepID=A0A9P0HKF2_NEZVI|nr:unnamed protein product [Nezara viridula]
MVSELVRACMLCLLCATHAHCSSHHNVNNTHLGGGLKASYENSRENSLQTSPDNNVQLVERSKRTVSEEDYIKLAFDKFGDGEKLNLTGFRNLLAAVGIKLISQGHSPFHKTLTEENNNSTDVKNTKTKCESLDDALIHPVNVTQSKFKEICPWIINEIIRSNSHMESPCHHDHEHSEERSEEASLIVVWVYASISVILISLCGLLAVAVIPLMQMTVYQGLLQFLVALAVGTLCGDALLHLLPHAMLISHGAHDHSGWNSESKDHDDQHDTNLWRGFIAALAVVFFYFTEKFFSMLTEWHKKCQRKNKKPTTRVHVVREETQSDQENRVGEKLCKHKYSSYPYCYGEITNSATDNIPPNGPCFGDSEINNIRLMREENGVNKQEEIDPQKEDVPCSEKQLLETADQVPEYTVIIREHETRHHGHAHTHGHVHSAPSSLSSVAWMVVMGDGLHNLADGLAIGTAFGANVGGGISTAVAVFCHELPHEIGDFAVLLKAGMSAKQAVFYNLLSSILCFFGMALGIALGHNDSMKQWVFAFAAGMFLYIALVDMVPELSSSHSKEGGSICQCLLQFCGLITGIGIMLVIALYEHALMESFQHSF